MPVDVAHLLERHRIRPSAQRVAIGEYVLLTHDHPSADEVWRSVKRGFPRVSRATVYNTLALLVERGLLRTLVLSEGSVVYDPHTEPHHHFVDEASGAIHDVPWGALKVSDVERLDGFEVHEYQVVLRGTVRPTAR